MATQYRMELFNADGALLSRFKFEDVNRLNAIRNAVSRYKIACNREGVKPEKVARVVSTAEGGEPVAYVWSKHKGTFTWRVGV